MSSRMMSLAAALRAAAGDLQHRRVLPRLRWRAGRPGGRRRASCGARCCAGPGCPPASASAPTKTLAKLANHVAKTAERKPGSYPRRAGPGLRLRQRCRSRATRRVMRATEVGDVWGVGRKIDATPERRRHPHRARSGARRRGHAAPAVQRRAREDGAGAARHAVPGRQRRAGGRTSRSCARARSATPVTELPELIEVVSEFASPRGRRSCATAGSVAGAVHVFIATSPYRKHDRQHSASATLPLVAAHRRHARPGQRRGAGAAQRSTAPASTT